MADITFNFTTPSEYAYDPALVQVAGGKGSLVLQSAVTPYNQPFSSDVGFTYDAAKAEFTGGLVRQKDQRPAGATFGATFTSGVNASWGGGSVTGTLVGAAVISGGQLDCSPVGNNAGWWVDTGNNMIAQTGAIKFRYTPSYTGAPLDVKCLVQLGAQIGTPYNRVILLHRTDGGLYLYLNDSIGTSVHANVLIGYWTPVAGTQYELEFNIDCTTPAYRLYINGVLLGAILTGTCTHTASTGYKIVLGNDATFSYPRSGKFDDVLLFPTVQHTSNYTPGYTVPEYPYATSTVTTPEMAHTGPGTILAVVSFATTEAGAPRWLIQINRSGNYLWWNGADWVVSAETYAQANTAAEVVAHATVLSVSGALYLQFKILFPDSGTVQSNVADMTINISENTGYPTTSPTLLTNISTLVDDVTNFSATAAAAGSDAVKYTLRVDSVDMYWTGLAWATSSGYTQSNTAAEILANLASLPLDYSYIQVKVYLHSSTGATSPEIDQIMITVTLSGASPVLPGRVHVYGWLYSATGPVSGEVIYIRPAPNGWSDSSLIRKHSWETFDATNSLGYFQGFIYRGTDKSFEFRIADNIYTVTIPDVTEIDFADLSPVISKARTNYGVYI